MKIKTPLYSKIFAGSDDGRERAEFAQRVWSEGLEELTLGAGATKSRAATLDRYVRARVEYEFLYPVASLEGPTHKSAKGNDYVNMKWASVQNLDTQILKHEKALGFHPNIKDNDAPRSKVTPSPEASKYLDRSKAH